MKICGIYKITSPSNKIYIGQSIDIIKRWNKYKGLHCKEQVKLFHSLQKYGADKHKFEILCQCDKLELNNLEIYYINLYQSFNSNHGLNLKAGGNRGGIASDETKRKMSISLKGRIHSNETRKKIKDTLTGHQISQETKNKIKDTLKGNIPWNKGKKMSVEYKKKMSESQQNRPPVSDETKNKMRKSQKKRVKNTPGEIERLRNLRRKK